MAWVRKIVYKLLTVHTFLALLAGIQSNGLLTPEQVSGLSDAESVFRPTLAENSTGEKIKCFEKCTCQGNMADCSQNFGNLTFIPRLPSECTVLNFSYNSLKAIQHDDFFKNVSQLTALDLGNNGLSFISPKAFLALGRLDRVHLDSNALAYGDLTPVFLAKKIKKLFLRNLKLGPPAQDFFRQKPMPRLRKIDLSLNPIKELNLSVFVPLPYLQEIWAAGCHLTTVISVPLPHLNELHLDSNALYNLPNTCSQNGSSLFHRLWHLTIEQNKITTLSNHICLPNLRFLDLSRNPISVFEKDMFRLRFPSLTQIMLQYIPWHSISRLEKFAFRHPRLAVVSLMSSNIPFVYESVDPECFAGSPRLSFLQLSHNKATGLSEAKFAQLFGSANNLNKLSLGDCDIETITKKTFSQLRKLRTLYLFQNKLTYIEGGAFDSLPDLRELNLGKNQLATVHASLFSLDTQRRLHSLDLSGNPFVCSCDLMWFKQWFVSSPSLFQHSHFTYTCRNSSGTVMLKDLSLVEQACLLSHSTSAIIITVVAVVLVLGSIVFTVYRHRWYIRLVLTFRTRNFARQQQRPEGNYCYDLFVSFASEDLDWVCEHLIPNLEDRLGLRLCVHERDFTPGKNILENIEDCVESSRRILMIFSQHFAHSNWCQFELNFCLRHVFENDDALLVMCLGDVASRELSSTMMAVLDTTTYIQWEERVEERGVFWERIEFALRGLLRQAQEVGVVA